MQFTLGRVVEGKGRGLGEGQGKVERAGGWGRVEGWGWGVRGG